MPQEVARAPQAQSELDKGWGRGPPFLLPLHLFPLSPSPLEGRGSRLGLAVLVGLPPLGAPLGLAGLPSPPLYMGAGAPPKAHQLFS